MSENQPMATGGPMPDCCAHLAAGPHGCTDCLNTGHAHDPAMPCPPEVQETPQDAQNAGSERLAPTGGTPGGVNESQAAHGAPVRSFGERLRDVATAHQTARPEMAAHIAGMADEADRLERGGAELGRQLQWMCEQVVAATNSTDLIDETGDGDWMLVWERLAELRPALEQARGDLAAQEGITQEMKASLDRLHTWAGLLELLDAHWPEDIFPTLTDDAARDTGPRLVSALRRVDQAEAAVERVRALHQPTTAPIDGQDTDTCDHCLEVWHDAAVTPWDYHWPCPTIAALDGGTEAGR